MSVVHFFSYLNNILLNGYIKCCLLISVKIEKKNEILYKKYSKSKRNLQLLCHKISCRNKRNNALPWELSTFLKFEYIKSVVPPSFINLLTIKWSRSKRLRLDPWVRKIPWRRGWQPTPLFLPGESHGQRSLVGYSPYGCKELDLACSIHVDRI